MDIHLKVQEITCPNKHIANRLCDGRLLDTDRAMIGQPDYRRHVVKINADRILAGGPDVDGTVLDNGGRILTSRHGRTFWREQVPGSTEVIVREIVDYEFEGD